VGVYALKKTISNEKMTINETCIVLKSYCGNYNMSKKKAAVKI
jgi:hypothetical protein